MKPLRIALTGGIASGKTTVCDYFRQHATPIIDADHIAHQLVEPGMPALKKIVVQFGENILGGDGQLDRALLKKEILNDLSKNKRLINILHPLIYQQIEEQYKKIRALYCVISIPLLIETNKSACFDRVLVVDILPKLQLQRIMSRDAVTRADALKILALQANRKKRNAAADDIILNDKGLKQLRSQVEQLHRLYIKIAAKM